MKKAENELPSYLVSSRCMLKSAFVGGVSEKQLESVAVILSQLLSLRNVGKVLEACGYVTASDGYYFAMAALADAHLEQNRQRKKAVVKLLREHGLDDWLQEHELPGDEGI